MRQKPFPVIDMVETGRNIVRLRKERGMTVRDLQTYFGFEEPQAIYKWQRGKSLPTVDNLYALGALLDVPMDEILVSSNAESNIIMLEQQDEPCCSNHFWPVCFGYGIILNHFLPKVIEPLVYFTAFPEQTSVVSGYKKKPEGIKPLRLIKRMIQTAYPYHPLLFICTMQPS